MTRNKNQRRNKKPSLNKRIQSILLSKQEMKSATAATTFVDTVAGVVGPISQQIIQGDNINNRSGDKITCYEIELNLSFLAGVGSTQSFHRFIIFQDRLNVGIAPLISEVLDGGTYNATYAIVNRQQRRFKILYDKMHGVVGGSNSAATNVQRKLTPNKQIFYNGTTSVVSANGINSIWFLCLTDSVTVSTATVSFFAKMSYTDS